MMKALMDLREILCQELEEEARKGELSAGSLETIHKLTDTIKNIDKILMLEGEDGGYSSDGSYGNGSYARRGSYGNGSYGNGSYGNGSYSDGYAGASRRGRHYVRGHYSRAEGQDMVKARITEMMQRGDMSGDEVNTLRRAMQILDEG